ncbi:MAG: ribonuclease P protein component [Candidatus Coprovivens sp.]
MKRIETIKDQKVFNNIIRNGKYKKNNYFVIYTTLKENLNPMYGIAISKKVGKAVIRNKLKRQTRFIIDNHRNLFKNSHNYIIMIRKSCANTEFKVLEKALVELLEK